MQQTSQVAYPGGDQSGRVVAEPVVSMKSPWLFGQLGCWLFAATAGLVAWHQAPPAALGAAIAAATALGAAASAYLEVLRWRNARRQLQRYVAQIDAAGTGDLWEQATPTEPEWIGMSRALNVMVERLRTHFAQRDERLQVMTEVVMHDPLTLLPSRTSFSQTMSEALADEDGAASGVLLIVRLRDLPIVNQRLGRAQGDELLRTVATSLRVRAATTSKARLEVFRMSGADFALLGIGVEDNVGKGLIDTVSVGLQQVLGSGWDLPESPAWVSGCTWQTGESVSEVLTRVDGLLQRCELEDRPTCWQGLGPTPKAASTHLSPTQWRDIIDIALETGRVGIVLSDVLGTTGLACYRQSAVSLRSAEGQPYCAEDFLPAARRVFRLDHLELRALELALAAPQAATTQNPILVCVSFASALRPSFTHRLSVIMQAVTPAPQCLWLALEAPSEPAQLDAYQSLLDLLSVFDQRAGLRVHGAQLDMLAAAADLGLTFVQVDSRSRSRCDDGSRLGGAELERIFNEMARNLGVEVLPLEKATAVLTAID